MKIANKISIYFLIVVLLLISGAVFILYRVVEKDLKKRIFAHLITTAQSKALHIETFLELKKEAIKQLAQSEILKELLLTRKNDNDYILRFKKVLSRLKNTVKETKYIFDISLIDKKGISIVSTTQKEIGQDNSNNACFLGGKKGIFIKDAYLCKDKKVPTIAFCFPVSDEENNFLGVVLIKVLMEGITRITTSRIGLGKKGEIYLVNKDGFMITPSRFMEDTFLKLKVDTEGVKKSVECLEKVEKDCKTFIYKNYRDVSVLGSHGHIYQLSWGLIVELDKKEAFAPLAKLKALFVSMVCVVSIITWIGGFLLAREIVLPIKKLEEGVERIGKGDLDCWVATQAKDEIGQLSRAFNKMTQDLKSSTTSVERLNQEVIQRKQVEERLLLFSHAVESAVEGVALGNLMGEISYVNEAFIKMFGYSRKEELIGRKITFFYYHDQQANTRESLKINMLNSWKGEITGRKKDGTPFPLEIHSSVVRNTGGRVIASMATYLDITERKHVKEKLQLFSHSTESAVEGIAIASLEGRFTYVNKAFVEMFGYSRETLLGKEIDFVYCKKKDEKLKLQTAIEGTRDGKWKGELLARRKDGRCFPIEVNSSVVKDNSGQVIALVASHMDIVQRKQTEEKIKRGAKEWEETFNAMEDFIFIMDKKQNIIKTNRAFNQLVKMKPEEIIGKKCYRIIHDTESAIPECVFLRAKEDKKMCSLEGKFKETDMHILINAIPLFGQKGEVVGAVHVIRDITPFKLAEEKMKESIKVKSDFLSMVSHELRTPLTAIKEGIGIVLDGSAGEINIDQEDFLATAKRNVDRLHRLINQVLDFSKLEARGTEFKMEERDINQAIKEIVKMQQPVVQEKGLYLKLDLNDNLEKILFDEDKISQVLTNLMNNAINHTSKGGITINSRKDGEVVRVGIKDTGEGIKTEELNKLFQQFQQVGKKFRKPGSTGLGLAISKEIVTGHKGKIWVESHYKVGSEFIFTLPIIKERRDKV